MGTTHIGRRVTLSVRDTFKVPQADQQELIAIVGSTRKDIVRLSPASQQ